MIPRRVLVVALGGILLIVLVVAIGSMRGLASGAATDGAPSASASRSAAQEASRAAHGPGRRARGRGRLGRVAALEKLSTSYPEDPAVWRALVRAYTKEKRGADAMGAVAKLVALSDRAKDDDEVSEAVTAAVAGPTESIDAALALLEGSWAPKGPTCSTISRRPKGSSAHAHPHQTKLGQASGQGAHVSGARHRAKAWAASGCESKKSLLGRAKEQGDSRALASLRNLQAPKGCGFFGARRLLVVLAQRQRARRCHRRYRRARRKITSAQRGWSNRLRARIKGRRASRGEFEKVSGLLRSDVVVQTRRGSPR